MHRLNIARCPAPATTRWGTLRCVTLRTHCTNPRHASWNRALWPMALLWAVKPWWPNSEGRAADARGKALNDALAQQDGVA